MDESIRPGRTPGKPASGPWREWGRTQMGGRALAGTGAGALQRGAGRGAQRTPAADGMPRHDDIEALDGERDHQRIVLLSSRRDFPFDTTRSLELALFRTFASPSIAGLLDRTGEFTRDPERRYEDTDLLVSELMEHGWESERGRRALARINELHARFRIPNDDYLYVLSTFVLEPLRWNQRFGWRRWSAGERTAWFRFWSEVGKRMDIEAIPASLEQLEHFSRQYEDEHFRPNPASARVGRATRKLFVSWFPGFLAPLVRASIHALLDEPLRRAFGFPPAPAPLRWAVPAALRARARLLASWHALWPRRRRPQLRTERPRALYPRGYTIEALGPAASGGAAATGSAARGPQASPR